MADERAHMLAPGLNCLCTYCIGVIERRAVQAERDRCLRKVTEWGLVNGSFAVLLDAIRRGEVSAMPKKTAIHRFDEAKSVCSDCANGNKPYLKKGALIHSGTEAGSRSNERNGFMRPCKAVPIHREESEL
jgi:hypothetical protein